MRQCKKRAAYLLVSKNISAQLALFPLDELNVGLHASLRKILGEEVRDVGIRVQATKLFGNLLDERGFKRENDAQ